LNNALQFYVGAREITVIAIENSQMTSKTKKVFLSQGSPGSKGVEGSDGDQVSEFSLSIVRLYDVYLFMIGI